MQLAERLDHGVQPVPFDQTDSLASVPCGVVDLQQHVGDDPSVQASEFVRGLEQALCCVNAEISKRGERGDGPTEPVKRACDQFEVVVVRPWVESDHLRLGPFLQAFYEVPEIFLVQPLPELLGDVGDVESSVGRGHRQAVAEHEQSHGLLLRSAAHPASDFPTNVTRCSSAEPVRLSRDS